MAFNPLPLKPPCFICNTMAFASFRAGYVALEKELVRYSSVYSDASTVIAAALRQWQAPDFLLSQVTHETAYKHFAPNGSALCKINRYLADVTFWVSRPASFDDLCKLLACERVAWRPLCRDAVVLAFWLDYYRERVQPVLELRGHSKKQLTSYLRAHCLIADKMDR